MAILKLKVYQNCVTDHCHRTSKDILKHYPSEGRLSPQHEKDVCDVLALHANNKLILGKIEKKFGKHSCIIVRDIQNLKAKIKKTINYGQKRLRKYTFLLADVLQKNCEDQAGVVVDEDNIRTINYLPSGTYMDKILQVINTNRKNEAHLRSCLFERRLKLFHTKNYFSFRSREKYQIPVCAEFQK